jgi:hypothetical protein
MLLDGLRMAENSARVADVGVEVWTQELPHSRSTKHSTAVFGRSRSNIGSKWLEELFCCVVRLTREGRWTPPCFVFLSSFSYVFVLSSFLSFFHSIFISVSRWFIFLSLEHTNFTYAFFAVPNKHTNFPNAFFVVLCKSAVHFRQVHFVPSSLSSDLTSLHLII